MISFVDAYRDKHGVEPICRVIKIAPSTYHAYAHRRAHPQAAPARVQRDATLKPEIERVFNENFGVYGARKVWRQLLREGFDVARCTVERLMKVMGLQGVVRGKRVRTTVPEHSTSRTSGLPSGQPGPWRHPRRPSRPGSVPIRNTGSGSTDRWLFSKAA